MKLYVFYRPENYQILGTSTQKDAMEFPFLEIKESIHSTDGYEIVEENGKIILRAREDAPSVTEQIEKKKKVTELKKKVKRSKK